MTSPLDGKVVPFGLAVDKLHEFIHAPEGDVETDAGSMPNLRKLANELRGIAADVATDTASDVSTAIEDRIYPGVYSTPPTAKPHSGEPPEDGDRCVILVGTVPYEHIRVGGGWVIPNFDSASLSLSSGSSMVGYDSGTAQDVLDAAKTLQSYTALRNYTGRANGVRITSTGIAGIFQRDDTDAASTDNAGTVIVDASGRRWKRVFAGPICVDWFGAGGNAATNTAAFDSAVAAAPDWGAVTLSAGKTYDLNSVNVSGKRITIAGYGATINCTGHANGALYKTDHGNRLSVHGVRFTGAGKAINYITATSGSMHDDFEFVSCRFENADYGVYLDGAREGRIVTCSFEGATNKGVYRVRSVNTDVVACFWKNTVYGVNDDGDGSPYSAGLKVLGGTMIGCGTGVISQRSDYCLVNGVMIDYCDNPVVFRGVDIGLIGGGCYITTRTTAPAILVDEHVASATTCREIRIIGNSIASNTDDVTSDTIKINKLASGEVSSNSITFWWRTGIDFSESTNLKIHHNKINNDPASTAPTKTSVLESAVGSNSNVVGDNEVSQPITAITAQVARNRGYATQSRGESASGVGVLSFTIPHGLDYVPTKGDVTIVPTNAEAAGKNPYVSAVDAINITVGFTAATAAAAGVGWNVRRGGSLS